MHTISALSAELTTTSPDAQDGLKTDTAERSATPVFGESLLQASNNLVRAWSMNGSVGIGKRPNLPEAAKSYADDVDTLLAQADPQNPEHMDAVTALEIKLELPSIANERAEDRLAKVRARIDTVKLLAKKEHEKQCPPAIYGPMHAYIDARDHKDGPQHLEMLQQLRHLRQRLGDADVACEEELTVLLYGKDILGGAVKTYRKAAECLMERADKIESTGELPPHKLLFEVRDRQWLVFAVDAFLAELEPVVGEQLDQQIAKKAADDDAKRKKTAAALVNKKPKEED